MRSNKVHCGLFEIATADGAFHSCCAHDALQAKRAFEKVFSSSIAAESIPICALLLQCR